MVSALGCHFFGLLRKERLIMLSDPDGLSCEKKLAVVACVR